MGPHSGTGTAGAGEPAEAACSHSWRQLCDIRGAVVQGPLCPESPRDPKDHEAGVYRAAFFCSRCLETRTVYVDGRIYLRGQGVLLDPGGQDLHAQKEREMLRLRNRG